MLNNIIIYYLLFYSIICANSALNAQSIVQKCIIENGLHYLDDPYVANTLESKQKEKLTYCSYQFDCVTFVEMTLALSYYHTKILGDDFEHILQKIRYRNGEVNGYHSRLHYYSDWIQHMESQGLMTNISKELGGEILHKTINFMTKNASKYVQLTDSSEYQAMKNIEEKLNQKSTYFIPQEKIATSENLIQSGDIIAFTTTIEGLDVSHVGFAIISNGKRKLLHASSEKKKVIISDESISNYVLNRKSINGIIVVRPK